jgi:hypothetical protein
MLNSDPLTELTTGCILGAKTVQPFLTVATSDMRSKQHCMPQGWLTVVLKITLEHHHTGNASQAMTGASKTLGWHSKRKGLNQSESCKSQEAGPPARL